MYHLKTHLNRSTVIVENLSITKIQKPIKYCPIEFSWLLNVRKMLFIMQNC